MGLGKPPVVSAVCGYQATKTIENERKGMPYRKRIIINNYWMRLSMISRIIQTEVNVICRSEAEADNIDRGLNNS
jgi:hypothetical protein